MQNSETHGLIYLYNHIFISLLLTFQLDDQYLKLQAAHEEAGDEKERLSVEIQKLADEKERVLSEQKRSFSKLQQVTTIVVVLSQ